MSINQSIINLMKSFLSLACLMMLVSFGFSQAPPRAVNSVSISPKAANKLRESGKLPSSLTLQGMQIKAGPDQILFGIKGKYLVINRSTYRRMIQNDKKALIQGFRDLGGGDLPGGIGSWFLFCSCGSNTSDSEGDGCDVWPGDSPSELTCEGMCSGGNEGSSCSFTGLHVYTDGSTKVIEQL